MNFLTSACLVSLLAVVNVLSVPAAEKSSFNCSQVESGSIADLICRDAELSRLDKKLAGVFAAASGKARNEHPPLLKTEQRVWIMGRDDCWNNDDRRGCVHSRYLERIAELQARYRLVSHTGPFVFACGGNLADEVVVTYFSTEPSTLIAERGGSVSLMTIQPSGSGARYQGRNESFWEHQGEAKISWGHEAPEMICKLKP
jgi:uncharacterized protein